MRKSLFIFALIFNLSFIQAYANDLSPENIKGAITIDTAKAKSLFDSGSLFIDTRKQSDFDAGRIPDAIHLELKSNFTESSLASEVSKNEALVCYCNGHSCMRSSKCSAKAVKWGFLKVYYYRDGFPAWKAAGHPVE